MGQLSLVIVGADHPNKDKSNRRTEILWSSPGEEVHLVPEPKNPVDPQAVAVFSARGVQVGYVKAVQAQLIRSYLARGRITAAIFQHPINDGAVIRVGLDGDLPTLPEIGSAIAQKRKPPSVPNPADHDDFWPDYIPPDD